MLHPKNKHQGHYPLKELAKTLPELNKFLIAHPVEGETIDFTNPEAVLTLNQALLKHYYGITQFSLPKGYLTPPIPGRADMLLYLADLIKKSGPKVRVLDIGVGANCIYPLLGRSLLGWSFVGSDINLAAVNWAKDLVKKNRLSNIELRHQNNPKSLFRGVIGPGEKFDLTICNPPFFASKKEAEEESQRKWKHLGHSLKADHRNFGGESHELWCAGGEPAFLAQMGAESAEFAQSVKWFSTLVSKAAHLKAFDRVLEKAGATEMHIIDMQQGQKKSRVVAWTFKT